MRMSRAGDQRGESWALLLQGPARATSRPFGSSYPWSYTTHESKHNETQPDLMFHVVCIDPYELSSFAVDTTLYFVDS